MDVFIICAAASFVATIIVAVAANRRGRNPVGWFLLSLLGAPAIGMLYPLGRQAFGFSRGLNVNEIERASYGFTGLLFVCVVASPAIAAALLFTLPKLKHPIEHHS